MSVDKFTFHHVRYDTSSHRSDDGQADTLPHRHQSPTRRTRRPSIRRQNNGPRSRPRRLAHQRQDSRNPRSRFREEVGGGKGKGKGQDVVEAETEGGEVEGKSGGFGGKVGEEGGGQGGEEGEFAVWLSLCSRLCGVDGREEPEELRRRMACLFRGGDYAERQTPSDTCDVVEDHRIHATEMCRIWLAVGQYHLSNDDLCRRRMAHR